jgi:hypothetical protein
MRNKTHILSIMTRLFLLWIKVPGLRLGQLIENCFHCQDGKCIYHLSDEDFISSLEDYYKDTETERREQDDN